MKRALPRINETYEDIMFSDLSDYQKTIKLSALMSEMEGQYKIPAFRNEAWEKENPTVLAMYRKISMSRSL